MGLYSSASGGFFLRNSHAAGAADLAFQFGPGGTDWMPMTGDWDGANGDSVGLFARSRGTVYLRNSNSAGPAQTTFAYGPSGRNFLPLTGDWNGPAPALLSPAAPSAAPPQHRRPSNTAVLDTIFSEED
jgi:hypothetical protein